MTTQIGEVIKRNRLEEGLTQAELAEGICTQATISNLENKGSLPTTSILLKITDRLKIEFNEIYEYSLNTHNGYNKVFKEIRKLCSKRGHKEAYDLLINSIDFNKLDTIYEIKQFYYFKGISVLVAYENTSDAIYYFNQALASESGNSLDFLDVSATNGIGIAYDIANEDDKAQTYYEKSLEQLDELLTIIDTINNSPEIAKIYYNTAMFYSKIGKYNKAVNLCSLGIQLLQDEDLTYYLEYLLYEKGFNLLKLKKTEEAEKFYLYAFVMADIHKNYLLLDVIKENIEKYNIKEYKYK
ncbi:helix-turn-helix transcriptional regulator [Carnobacterium maltaromaticum]|uniref:helix-turn-helix transcriptional regulator n=1 Tax=Carnobacterium maltaromaticum TaxID=2751 RepID=UPI00026C867B|nr:helix-turn-helix transcriptional regulator [Carnobacterium maltaromaticum]